MNPFLEKLAERPLLGDGAMGTMLFARGASSEQCLEQLVVERPGWVTGIHQAYASAGADIITAHTFGANRMRLAAHGLEEKVHEFNFRAVRLVRDVREVTGRGLFIAGNIGPLGRRLQLDHPSERQSAEEAFKEQIEVLWEAGADLLIFETFSDLEELAIGVRAAKEICDLPIVASMTYAEDALTLAGQSPVQATQTLIAAGADLVGVNCSIGPLQTYEILRTMHDAAPDAMLSAMPNAGFPRRVAGRLYYPSSPEYFADHVVQFVQEGAHLMGGCCGTTPMHIHAMRLALDELLTTSPKVRDTAKIQIGQSQIIDSHAGLSTDFHEKSGEGPTGLLRKLQAGKFVISVEVDPPRAFTAEKQLSLIHI